MLNFSWNSCKIPRRIPLECKRILKGIPVEYQKEFLLALHRNSYGILLEFLRKPFWNSTRIPLGIPTSSSRNSTGVPSVIYRTIARIFQGSTMETILKKTYKILKKSMEEFLKDSTEKSPKTFMVELLEIPWNFGSTRNF